MKIRIISLILLLTLSLCTILTSCGEEVIEYDETELISTAGTLIRKSAEFNIIFWGDGIPFEEGTNYDNGIYSPSMSEYKYTLIDDIIKDAENIFSSGYMTTVKRTIFSAQFGDTGVDGYARYYQETELDPIMVRTDYKPVLVDKNEYLYDTIVIDGADENAVYVKISIKVTRDDAYQIITSRIKLVNEDGWRIDNHTFANYNTNI